MILLNGTVIAVDFDGTCVTHEYPNVGREIGAVRVLKRMVGAGAKLILWTMRSDGCTDRHGNPTDPLTDAVRWFEKHGIPLYGIQRNPTQDRWTTSPKAEANVYIDDAALGCPLKAGLRGERPYVDWDAVEAILFPALGRSVNGHELKEGQQWHRTDWSEDMLPEGWRPLIKGEQVHDGDQRFHSEYGLQTFPVKTEYGRMAAYVIAGPEHIHFRTRRPLPPPPKQTH